jgi:hypothetical protein
MMATEVLRAGLQGEDVVGLTDYVNVCSNPSQGRCLPEQNKREAASSEMAGI